MQTDIPLIDFSPFLLDDPVGKAQVATDIYRACHDVGFLYLTHHGIPPAAIDAAFAESQRFFALPLAAKQAIAWSSEVSNRGYIGLERERLDETQPGDLKEAFNLGQEIDAAAGAAEELAGVQNRWPLGQDDFRATLTDFYQSCATAAARIFRAFALALAMPEDFLVSRHAAQAFTLRLLHYPPLQTPPQPGQIRAGAHSDYGTLTLLFQDDVGGLEVLGAEGNWISAPAIPGAVLINTGDLTERWSNGVFRSTRHRVGLPQGAKAQCDRYSMAFFCGADPDTEIACLPTCQGPDHPPQYPPIKAREYLLSRLQATY
jgi:isopenicillin N synthase-like dioxygenase